MTPQVVLDENASLLIAERLRALGYEVVAVAEGVSRSLSDKAVFELVSSRGAILISRDAHFTNSFRFDPSLTGGILHIVHGNLTAKDEADMVEAFLKLHAPDSYRGRLVLLARTSTRIR